MYIGMKDAVAIYAKACRARYGALARRVVVEQAQALLTNGDRSGAEVWQQVAAEIEKAEGSVAGVSNYQLDRITRSDAEKGG